MNGFRILDLDCPADYAEWLDLWNQWPRREVFAHPEYLRLYCSAQSRALCAACQSGDLGILHPFLLRNLASEPFWAGARETLLDATSAYGYAGPFVWGSGDRERVAGTFWAEFRDWARERRVVSEFVRLSLFPRAMLRYPGETWQAAKQIIRPLDLAASELWMDFDHKVRKNVSHAQRCGVQIEVDDRGARLEDFLKIYVHTMDRRGALDAYRFPRAYFEQIGRRLPGQFVYFHAVRNGVPVSSELVLVSENSVYSFLGGTLEEAFQFRPNDLLKFEIMNWARERGKSHFVLGGGYRGEDGIYRYKRAFAPRGQAPYWLGGQIFSQDLFAALLAARQSFASGQGQEWRPQPGFFPAYRS
jgi:Acetyltransferase (GNAT) domain